MNKACRIPETRLICLLIGFAFLSSALADIQINVRSSGASGVTITSNSGHGGVTPYTIHGIPENSGVDLQAPLWSGRKMFTGWDGCTVTSGTDGSSCTVSEAYNWNVIANYSSPASTDFFVTTWKTDNFGAGGPTTITVPIVQGPYLVDWNNDGILDETVVSGPATHDFGVAGEYTIGIVGSHVSYQNHDLDYKLLSIDQWGTAEWWGSMEGAFQFQPYITMPATDTPDFSHVTSMSSMFQGTYYANPETSGWDTSWVNDMSHMFHGARKAKPNTSGWDTSGVTDMSYMFYYARAANPDTGNWNTSLVTNMSFMFHSADSANPDTRDWYTGSVRNMEEMFSGATVANPDVTRWRTDRVTNMTRMFKDAVSFDRNIGSWDVQSLTDATEMFSGVTLSKSNYEALLIGWGAQALKSGVTFDGGNSRYCSAEAVAAKTHMTDTHHWSITDGGQVFRDIIVDYPDEEYRKIWENYGGFKFSIHLVSAPLADVSIAISSDNTSEGTVSQSSVVFTPTDWAEPKTVWVNAVDDPVEDGDVQFNIILEAAVSEDSCFNGIDPVDIPVVNIDDDELRVEIWGSSLTTTEGGGIAKFDIVLTAAPLDYYEFAITVIDTTEGEVLRPIWGSYVTFYPWYPGDPDWYPRYTVEIKGMDDAEDDGDITYSVSVEDLESYAYYEVWLMNLDDDTAGVTVSTISGDTTETGDTATFTIVLDSKPTDDVTIGLTIDDTTEGTVSPASMTFTDANWDVPQLVTVTGLDDDIDDGDVVYNIIIAAATSVDDNYNGFDPSDVQVTNIGTDFYSIGGTVSGLTGTGLVLQNNAGDDLAVSGNGDFTFAVALKDGSDYVIKVLTQPSNPKQFCSLNNGSGTLDGAAVTDVEVACETLPEIIFQNGFEPTKN